MRARMLFGYALVVAIAAGVLGCGGTGGNSAAPAGGRSLATGSVSLVLNPERTSQSTTRSPKYVPPGVTGIAYVVRQGATVIVSGNATFGTCPSSGPCSVTIAIPAGTGYIASVTESAGSVVVGSGQSASFDIVAGTNPPVSMVMDAYAGAVSVAATNGPVTTWVADGTTQYQAVSVSALDRVGDQLTTQYGALPNYSITFSNTECGSVTDPTSPPAPTPSTSPSGQFVYDGSYPCAGNQIVNLNAYINPVSATPLPVAIAAFTAAPDLTYSSLGQAQMVTFTETNSTNTSFSPSDTCGGALSTSAPAVATVGANKTVTYTLTVTSLAGPCSFTSQPADHPSLGTTILGSAHNGTVNIYPPGTIVVQPQSKRGPH